MCKGIARRLRELALYSCDGQVALAAIQCEEARSERDATYWMIFAANAIADDVSVLAAEMLERASGRLSQGPVLDGLRRRTEALGAIASELERTAR